MNDKNQQIRNVLKIAGPILIVVGIVLIILGRQGERDWEERRNQQSREFMAGQRDIHDIDNGVSGGFFLLGAGMFTIVAGIACLGFAYQRAFLQYQAREYAPVLKEAIGEVAPALSGGKSLACPSCHTANATDAKFCKECGLSLEPKACAKCGATNESGAKFCTGCGSPL